MGNKKNTSDKNRKNINFNGLQEDVKKGNEVNKVNKVSIVWNGDMPKLLGPKKKSQNVNGDTEETAYGNNVEEINLKEFRNYKLDSNQALKSKNLADRFDTIVKLLKERKEPLLFWSATYIKNIHEKLENSTMPYWRKYAKMIECLSNQKSNSTSDNLEGEDSSYIVAIDKKMITINMITDELDGKKSVDWDMMSKAFAMGAKDVVFFLTGGKNEGKLGPVWKNIERKALINNKDVGIIVELDLINPEKINSVIIKNSLDNAERYGFKLPFDNSKLRKSPLFKGTFKLKFEADGIKHVQLDENGAEKENTVINLNELLGRTKKNQGMNANKINKNTNGDEHEFEIGM